MPTEDQAWIPWLLSQLWPALVGSGLALAVSGFFGKRVVEHWFEKKKNKFQLDLDKQMEDFRFELNGLMNRKTKLYQEEFKALPEAWGLLAECWNCMKRTLREHKLFDETLNVPELERRDYYRRQDFAPWLIEKIEASPDKTKTAAYALDVTAFLKASKSLQVFASYREKSDIFLPEDIAVLMRQLEMIITGALEQRRLALENQKRSDETPDHIGIFFQDGFFRLALLREALKTRLWSSETPRTRD
jgi:hypothetical protein